MKRSDEIITAVRVCEIMAALRPDSSSLDRTPKAGCVEGAIGNAISAAMYADNVMDDEDELDVLHVAAFLLRSLAKNHCFMDGNKRIAFMVAREVLEVHALVTLEVDQTEAAGQVNAVATGEIDVPELTQWMQDHLVPLAGRFPGL